MAAEYVGLLAMQSYITDVDGFFNTLQKHILKDKKNTVCFAAEILTLQGIMGGVIVC